ncbi:uncharacterized protein LOC105162783 [Sesamum indicum]|uniref:Uncharacterized protein LOC105162783 n=1 Tax=Sesamum indicum TaxID=4182 RepID=A0A6I9T5E7_SESIN|nr:uncharacterized protein LOC105162783 [Sesamum indicum]
MASSSNTTPDIPVAGMNYGTESSIVRNQLADHSNLVMVSAPFNGANWLTWSRSIRIALERKDKLGFIDGSFERPNEARTLWIELETRYGECDGPLLYKIQREISSVTQGNLSVTAYFTKLKQLWDELICLMPPAMCSCGNCTCGCNNMKIEQNEANQLMQFLMGLGEPHDSIRSQILVLDPLPNVNKAYSMVLRVERQRIVKGTEFRFNSGNKNYMKKKGITDKRSLVCDYCNKQGHNKDSCFKLHGFPDWYKDLNEQRKRGSSRAFAVNDGPISMEKSQRNELLSDLLEALQMVQNKAP